MNAPEVFLSYNSADRPSVIAVQKMLQAHLSERHFLRTKLSIGGGMRSFYTGDNRG